MPATSHQDPATSFPPACSVCGLSALDDLGGKPICAPCKARAGIGLGDVLKKITTAIGIPPCGGCRKRAEKLNKLGRF